MFFMGSRSVADKSRRSTGEKLINIVFRLDDYSALSSMDMELRIIDLFRKNSTSITFGVIPYLCARNVYDPSPQEAIELGAVKGEVLRSASAEGVLEVALHGYSHQTISAKCHTEFSGLDYHSQVERIAKGKELLERVAGAPITTFVPPWNRHDANTLRALEELGFSVISASLSQEAAAGYGLKFLPETCDLLRLRRALSAAQKSPATHPLIVVAFHLFEILEVDSGRGRITFGEFSELVNGLGRSADVRMMSVRKATTVIPDLSAECFLQNRRMRSRWRGLPRSWQPAGHNLYHCSG